MLRSTVEVGFHVPLRKRIGPRRQRDGCGRLHLMHPHHAKENLRAGDGPVGATVAGFENAVAFAADINNVGIGGIDGERMEHRVLIIADIALQGPIDERGAIVGLGKRPERQQRHQYENSKATHDAEIPKFDLAT